MNSKPNLLLIGFPRCGTTALAYTLSKHPDIFVCEPKEPHFLAFNGTQLKISGPGKEAFSTDRVYKQEQWQTLFSKKDDRYLLDASVTTVSYPESSTKNIEMFCDPDVRLIVMLRDPVERAHSSYLYNLARGWNAGSFEEGLEKETQRIKDGWQHLWFFKWLSDYEPRMQPFETRFGRSNICYLSTEEFKKNPQRVANKICRFLNIENMKIDSSERVNAGGKPRSRAFTSLTRIIRGYPVLHGVVKKITSQRLRERVREINLSRPGMRNSTRIKLETEFQETKAWMLSRLNEE